MNILSKYERDNLNILRGVVPFELLSSEVDEGLLHYSEIFKNNENRSEDPYSFHGNYSNNISLDIGSFKERIDSFRKIL